MPYILQEQRPVFDDAIHDLVEQITTVGQLNYVFSKIALGVAMNSDADYTAFNGIDGVFGLAQAEFRRRVIFPYEDLKLRENGDLFDDNGGDDGDRPN